MSKELEKAKGVDIVRQYHSKEIGSFELAMIKTYVKPTKHWYYELVDNKGKIVQSFIGVEEIIVKSIAIRTKLNYRLVEYEERWEDLDENE